MGNKILPALTEGAMKNAKKFTQCKTSRTF